MSASIFPSDPNGEPTPNKFDRPLARSAHSIDDGTQLADLLEQERQQIGQELHDIVQSGLIGLSFMTQRLIDSLAAEAADPIEAKRNESLKAIAVQIANALKESVEQVRLISHGLVARLESAELLPQALEGLASRTHQLYQMDCRFAWDQRGETSDIDVATQLFRIAQEAITNCVKHSGSDRIEISLAQQDEGLLLLIRDNGRGVGDSHSRAPGSGLAIMQNRAQNIGAQLSLQSDANGATLHCFWRPAQSSPTPQQ
ncbi:sensor histidine kinase [Blastopirellula marina]|uniref:histidine kinase n=1 Tax=Blastopirellula marina DSM 3645 TaxID=314230 RepID=A3ZTK7_9BACT|nr:ATP-binding protein [Blastopirellula marina]EAQ80270.1 sensor protein degs [Blastopirellula marina DSM 3645]